MFSFAGLKRASKLLARSLATRGVGTTLAAVAGKLDDYWFDLRHGTRTAGRVDLDALEIPSANKTRAVNYMPTHARAFRKLMRSLSFPKDSVLVDLGCGKGKILILACEQRFKRVVGVEFSRELCGEARWNVSNFKKRGSITTDVEIVESDVSDYSIRNDENVFFLFNPFDAVVLAKVLRSIRASLEQRRRPVWLIYNQPVCRDVIQRSGLFVEAGTRVCGSSQFAVYVSAAN